MTSEIAQQDSGDQEGSVSNSDACFVLACPFFEIMSDCLMFRHFSFTLAKEG